MTILEIIGAIFGVWILFGFIYSFLEDEMHFSSSKSFALTIGILAGLALALGGLVVLGDLTSNHYFHFEEFFASEANRFGFWDAFFARVSAYWVLLILGYLLAFLLVLPARKLTFSADESLSIRIACICLFLSFSLVFVIFSDFFLNTWYSFRYSLDYVEVNWISILGTLIAIFLALVGFHSLWKFKKERILRVPNRRTYQIPCEECGKLQSINLRRLARHPYIENEESSGDKI